MFITNLFSGWREIFSARSNIIGLVAFISFWGFNFSFWGIIGLARLIQERYARFLEAHSQKPKSPLDIFSSQLTCYDVAAIVPAHNEELVIAKTISSLLPLVPRSNIFIISDGSIDKTAEIARSFQVNVLELNPSHGKAGALETGIAHFSFGERFKAVIFVDADTVLPNDYLDEALPFFTDPEVVAIAGYARTIWDPAHQSFRQIYFIAHREIVYTLSQLLLKFGQSWKHANVANIVPGFASIYRSSILNKINLNPSGLVIEDFNMTFEVHHKNLGRIVHSPKISGYTQDPDNFHDYFRQVKRWDLGFWQTVKHHGLWPSKFSASLVFFLIEVVLSSLILLVVPIVLVTLSILIIFSVFQTGALELFHFFLKLAVLAIWVPNMIISIIAGIIQKRPRYFYYAPFFIFLKFMDSVAFFDGLLGAFLIRSSGRWISPERR